MATVDLSRDATDFRKRYAGVRMQQGRVLTDDDFNSAMVLDEEDMRRTRVDVIGPFGSPDAGFLPVAPAAPLPSGGEVTFTISAGTLYLGGLRLEQPAAETFDLQKDWLNFDLGVDSPNLPTTGSRIDLIWIEAWHQPVAAEEDKEKYEAALGSADSSMHVRTMRRVAVRTNVQTEDCAVAWAQAAAAWAPTLGTIGPDMELVTQARVRVTFTAPADPGDLCSPPMAGGYLGAENQAIRVQMVDATHYTWGFDNAAPIYRVQLGQIVRNGATINQVTLLTAPKDAVHWPLKDQIVEILPWSAALPNGEVLASLSGHLARVTASYNPDDQTLEIDTALPAGWGQQWKTRADVASFFDGTAADDYFFLRVWNRGDDITSPPAIPIASGDLGSTGLHVDFSGAPLRPQDHWIIGARPATPDQVVPWRLEDVNGAPPNGEKRYRAPLALIRWTVSGGTVSGEVIHDCRPPFQPLTRLRGCCTVTVGNGTTSFGMFTSIQAAVNALPPSGGTVCVLPGDYLESVLITGKKRIVIHGCDARARVRAANAHGDEPAFRLVDCEDVGIERLGIEAGPRSAVDILRGRRVAVRECLIQMRDVPTIYQAIFARGVDMAIERNVVHVLSDRAGGGGSAPRRLDSAFDSTSPPPPPASAGATRGGIQLGGGCERVVVDGNVIEGGIWNGITLGSLIATGGGNEDEDVPDKPTTLDPCDPCRPLDQTGDDDDVGGPVRFRSAGDLADITIRDNVIRGMGANGIGVVRFFNIGATPVLVSVDGLHIQGNRIERNLWRTIQQPKQAMQFLVAYGGIALALASDLRICDNEIVQNGASHLDPVCGIFALMVENLEIHHNRIIDNGPRRAGEPEDNAANGIRGGIWIWLALVAPGRATVIGDDTTKLAQSAVRRLTAGVPAAVIRDNIVTVPLGRAITIFALGPLTIARNRLVSMATTGRSLDVLASAVLAINLGVGNDWTIGLLAVLVLELIGANPGVDMCAAANVFGILDPDTNTLRPPFSVRWPSGKTLVTENHITSDTIDAPLGSGLSAVMVASLDDVGFTDNQCEVDTVNRFFLTDVMAMAGTVRMADNRLSETWRRAFFSGWAIGILGTVTDNHATHCLTANAGQRVLRDNLQMINVFCQDECRADG